MTHKECSRGLIGICLLFAATLAVPASAEWKEKVLYSFQGGSDGATPAGGVAFDKKGNLYGATTDGGSACPSPGCGTVFQLTPPAKKGAGAWTETILYGFSGSDGSQPAGGVIMDAKGNLYGTTAYGGSGTCILLGSNVGCGIVYELSPPAQQGGKWTYIVLYNFQGGKDGQYPRGDLIFDRAGNLYGATVYGGGYGTCNAPYFQYCGTIFKLNPPKKKGGKWEEKVLHSFRSVKAGKQFGDGANPNGGLVLDNTGTIYGTTYFGGNNVKGECEGGVGGTGCGVVFALQPPTTTGGRWTEKTIHRFDGQDGANSTAGVVFDGNGNLYGTTFFGAGPYGLVFELKKPSGAAYSWTETVLHRFRDGNDGANPASGLVLDANGNVYGTAFRGSVDSRYGDVFRLKPPSGSQRSWTSVVLYGFHIRSGGGQPMADLAPNGDANFYGTTLYGGAGTGCGSGACGTVFEVRP